MTFGAVMIEGIQLIFILMSYRFLAANPAFDRVLHYLALPVFLGLAGYYLLAKSNIKTEVRDKNGRWIESNDDLHRSSEAI